MKTTSTIEKYELRISFLINRIEEIKRLIKQRKGIKEYVSQHLEKVEIVIQKLVDSQKSLMDAVGLLLQTGNK